MGNTSSNASNRPSGIPNRPHQFPSKSHDPTQSPTRPTGHTTHHSLRSKKKSLELPDLASLALTNNNNQNSVLSPHLPPYRRPPPPTSAPIPIPPSANSNPNGEPRSRPQNNFASTQVLPDVTVEQPSTHIPINHHRTSNQPTRGAEASGGSTRSFTTKTSSNQMTENGAPHFVQETVYSTIPLALLQAEQELAEATGAVGPYDGGTGRKMSGGDDAKEPIPVKITWRGGGKLVYVARADDNNWKGRHPMQQEYVGSHLILSSMLMLGYAEVTQIHGLPHSHFSLVRTTSSSSSTNIGGWQQTFPLLLTMKGP
jgi:hypothetical protein